MKKNLISILLTLCIMLNCSCFAAVAQAADFTEVSIDILYSTEGVSLVVSGVTPAAYGQRIIMAAYEPAMPDGLTAELRNAEDPSAAAPLKTPAETEVFRFDEITAKKNGEFYGEWPLNEGIENGDYIIVKLSGTGKTPVSASKLFYFESPETFQSVTLRELESLTGDELGEFLVEKKLLLGLEKEDSYYLDNEFEGMFTAVRDNDFQPDADGHRFDGTEDVVKALNWVEALQNLPAAPTATDIATFIRDFGDLLSYDFSTENSDYTLKKGESHSLAAGIITQTPPICFTDVERIIEQAVGIAMLNSKDSSTIGPVVTKYAAILGIDATAYENYCNTYTAYEVNKAFVERGFKLPSEVPAALSARVAILAAGGDSTSNPPDDGDDGDGGGGGGGGGSNPSRPVSGATTNIGTEVKPVPGADNKSNYSDLSHNHWAAESVKALRSKNVINGFPDGTFRPDDAVTREQLVKMLVEAFKLTGKSDASFSDVATDRWSAAYIDAALACGIVQGVEEGSFAPEKAVSRQDAAVMLARLCDIKAIELSGSAAPTDSAIIASYAQESVFRLAGAGVICGFEDGSFRPNEVLTRAQSAKLIYGLLSR